MPVGPNLGLSRDGIRFSTRIAGGAQSRRPGSRAFQAAIDARHRRSPTRRWRASSSTSTATAPTTSSRRRRDRAALLQLLKPRPGLYARLSEMHDCGLLGRVFPEFQAISWRVVRDFYHKYTVDEHTLLTIRNLERLVDDRRRRAAMRFSNVLARLGRARAARAGAAVSRRRQVARRRPRARERAHGAADVLERLQLPATRARRSSS